MDDQYDLLSRFYRELITTSGHLKNEQDAILNIISKLNLTHNNKILDAACGTGDALHFLFHNGYTNLSGLDFSKKMIEEAMSILPNIQYYYANWNSLIPKVGFENQFDLILVISVSILHIGSISELETAFCSFQGILRENGTLVIDNRKWQNGENGLVEKDREENRSNHICKSNIAGVEYNISDRCHYYGDKQVVEYEIKSDNSKQTANVSYLRIATSTIVEMLYRIGFRRVTTECYSTWPYELIYAYK